MPARRLADAQGGNVSHSEDVAATNATATLTSAAAAPLSSSSSPLDDEAFVRRLLRIAHGTLHDGDDTAAASDDVVARGVAGVDADGNATHRAARASDEQRRWYLTSHLAHALDADDYWTSLSQQIRVDFCVDMVCYCAAHGYSALKTQHVLQRTLAFKALVEQTGIADDDVHNNNDNNNDTEVVARRVATRLHRALCAFADDEQRKWQHWQQVAHDVARRDAAVVVATPTSAAASSSAAAGASALSHVSQSASASSAASTARGRKPGRANERPRQQQQQQQQQQQMTQEEYEEAQRRLAAAAALPAENVYLANDELLSFCTHVCIDDLLQHAALYRYVAHHAQADAHANDANDAADSHTTHTFCVHVEAPMHTPPLSMATRMHASTMTASAAADATTAAPAVASSRHRQGSVATATTTTTTAAIVASDAAVAQQGAAHTTTTAAAVAALDDHDMSPSHIAVLHAARDAEMAALQRAHRDDVEAQAQRQRDAQTAHDMELRLRSASAQRVAEDVYNSLEADVATRQQRTLQRLHALECALGLASDEQSPQTSSLPQQQQHDKSSATTTTSRTGSANAKSHKAAGAGKRGK